MLTCVYIYLINKYKCFLDINAWKKLVFDNKYIYNKLIQEVLLLTITINYYYYRSF